MKRNIYLSCLILSIALFFRNTTASAQVTVTSSDSLDCTHPSTTLTAHLTGDVPTDAGITADDVYSPIFPIGFTFKYYGVNYTQIVIGANGTLDFTTADAGAYDPWPISGALLGNSSKYNNICGPWCDIDIFYTGVTVGSETYSTDGVAPNRKFAVTWCACSMFSCGTQKTTTQIILYETTNIIEVHITKKLICAGWNGGYAIVGVQNATGTAATTAPGRDYPSTWTNPPTEAWRFTPTPAGTAYTVTSIPYAPIPYASSLLYWYNATTGAYLGTGTTLPVTPVGTTIYKCGALGCADTSWGYYMVSPSGGVATNTTPVNPTLTATINPVSCGSCNGSITLNSLSPGLVDTVRYSYNGVPQPAYVATVTAAGTIVLNNLCAGIYNPITVAQGTCVSAPVSDTLVNPPLTMAGTSISPTTCGGTNGSITLTGLYPGQTYTITYTYNGTVAPPLVFSTGAAATTITITNLSSGVYTNVGATFGNGCVIQPTGPFFLTNPPISMTGVPTNPTYCGVCDGFITLSGLYPSTAYVINYNFGGVPQPTVAVTTSAAGIGTITGLCAGTYDNIIAGIAASFDSCKTPAVGPFTIAPPAPPVLNIIGSTNPTQCGDCNGTITIKSIKPFSTDSLFYTFNGAPVAVGNIHAQADSSILLSGLCAGTYGGFTVHLGGCVYTVNGNATLVSPTIHSGFDTAIHYGCHGDTVQFTNLSSTNPAGGILYFSWNLGNGITNDTETNPLHIYPQGTYTVTLRIDNGFGCADSTKITIPLIHPLHAAFIDSPTIVCQKNPIIFTNTSTVSGTWGAYEWTFGNGASDTNKNTAYTYQNTGVYTVTMTVTDWIPCHDTATSVVQVDTLSGIKITPTDTVICEGTYITYTGLYAGIGYLGNLWNFGDGYTISNVNPVMHGFDATGVFTVSIAATYRACASIATTAKITVIPEPHVNLGPDTTICIGSTSVTLSDVLNSGNPSASWLWNTGNTGPSISVTAPGYYSVTVNVNNCYSADTVWVQNDCYMDIPNVFTPNGDGTNDYFFPRQMLTKGLTTFAMNIYNRWGQLVFQSTSLDGKGWDGKLNDMPQPEGVYVFIIDATFKDGQKEHHQGNVTLMR